MTAEVLARKLAKILDKLARISELGPSTLEVFTGDRSRRDLCSFYLALAIEDCIDVAEHLIAERAWGSPDSYGESFRLLARHGVLPAELTEKMVQAAGMRNAILHEYDDIDWARVHSALTDLSRIHDYVAAVQRFPGG